MVKDPEVEKRVRAEDEAELWRAITRKRRATDFVKGDFYKKHLEPYLGGRSEVLPKSALWTPQDKHREVGAVALVSAFNGGAFNEIEQLRGTINNWIELGEEAETELRKRGVTI